MPVSEKCYEYFSLSSAAVPGELWNTSLLRFLCDEQESMSYVALAAEFVMVAIVILYYRRIDAQIGRGEEPIKFRNGVIALAASGLLFLGVVFRLLAAYDKDLLLIITLLPVYLIIQEISRFNRKHFKD